MSIERRHRMDLMNGAELAIVNAMAEVELLGADVNLTEAIVSLQKAKDLVSDFVDLKAQSDGPPPPPPVLPGPK